MYIIFGPPDEIESHPIGGQGAYPHEIWQYRYLEGIGTYIRIEFVDKSMTGEYRLTLGPSEKMIELNQLNRPDPNSGAPRNSGCGTEIRAPLDPLWMQFQETDGAWRAVVQVYGRVRRTSSDA